VEALLRVVDGQALLGDGGHLRQQLLLGLQIQGPVGLQDTAEVRHLIPAGFPLGVGAHDAGRQLALLCLDLLRQLPHRGQLQGPPQQPIGFSCVGLAVECQQPLGVGESG
jgi:hypothetical protein